MVAESKPLGAAPGDPVSEMDPDVRLAIHQELESICGDKQFRSSRQSCAFLRFVVSETLAGRAGTIKERTLGVLLLGRSPSYDTGSDSAVRVRATEVRRRLSCYYEERISQAGWRIHIPLRSYVPIFVPESKYSLSAQPFAAPAPETRTTPLRPTSLPSLMQMMMPTLVALFLCAATFRWQVSAATPYIDFWQTLLTRNSALVLVLDASTADPNVIEKGDLNAIGPLVRSATSFGASVEVQSSDKLAAHPPNAVSIHISHRFITPGIPLTGDPMAAYISVLPDRHSQVWISSLSYAGVDFAVRSISSEGLFPNALDAAVRRHTPSRIRIASRQPVTIRTTVNKQ